MAKIQNISEIHPTLGFTEFDVLEKYRKSFNESELGRLHSVFPFDRMAKDIHYQMFCGIMIDPSFPITNYKIISAIRNEMASLLDIESLQEVLASHWKPYLENLHISAGIAGNSA